MAESLDRTAGSGIHLNLDDAWDASSGLTSLDARQWGPQLRFCAPPRLIERFFAEYDAQLAPFVPYGSGDFHHLSALWLQRVREPVVLNRIFQSARDVFLPHDGVEILRTIFAGENLVAHGG